MCQIGKKEPLFYWKTREGAILPLETERISLTAAEDEAWERYGQDGQVLIEIKGEFKEFT